MNTLYESNRLREMDDFLYILKCIFPYLGSCPNVAANYNKNNCGKSKPKS